MKRKVISSALAVSFALLFNFCGGNEQSDNGGRVTVTFWHSLVSATTPALEELIERFEKEHPGIDIKAQYIPGGEAFIQKLGTSIRSQTAPDVSWLHSHFMEDLVEADAIYPMSHFIEGENGLKQEDLDDIYPALLQYASWRGTLYSMPMEATNLALLYNKDMFRKAGLDPEKPPKNWDELYDYAKNMTLDENGDGKYEQVGLFLPVFPADGPLAGWMVWQWMPYLWQAGGYVITEEQEQATYNSPAGIKALQLWQKIYKDLNLSVFTTDFDVAFASKNLAMAMDGPWNLPRYKEILEDIDWAFAPLPRGPEKSATIVGGEYLAIFKQSENPDSAWAFVKWITQPEIQAMWSMKSGYLPIRRSVREIPEFKEYTENNPNYKVFVDQMDVSQAQRPVDYGGVAFVRHIGTAIEEATIGSKSPEQALNDAVDKSNEILKNAGGK